MGNFAAALGTLLCGGSVDFHVAPILIRLLALAKEDISPTLHLACGQSISSLPLIGSIDDLNLKLLLDSITSNSGVCSLDQKLI